MKRTLPAVLAIMAMLSGADAASLPVSPFEQSDWPVPESPIDRSVGTSLAQRGITPALPCSDEVFIRRAYLDLTGRIPPVDSVLDFLSSEAPDRRAILIDDLLDSDEFVSYATLQWCDLLRVKSEFPINLWPNAVQAYHRWVHAAVRENVPYDRFARDLLTSSGSNFRMPQVNFYRAMQGSDPQTIASAAALSFMGARIERWPEAQQQELAAFFSRLAFKGTAEWKEEIVFLDPAPAEAFTATLPDGTTVRIQPQQDPREVFADWLISPENPWFARAAVNRIWYRLMGRGIIHEPDDIRPDNPPANPELLALLEKTLVAADWDLREVYRLVMNSRTYQQSAIARSDDPQAEALFAHYIVRRLDAEVLIDALCWLGGDGESYSSMIPEPFTWIPEYHPTVELADGSITSQFLEMFGRPSRDTGLLSERDSQFTEGQALQLLNARDVHRRIEQGPVLREIAARSRENRSDGVRLLYLTLLSREPTVEEFTAVADYARDSGGRTPQALVDVAWALINSKEFLYRH